MIHDDDRKSCVNFVEMFLRAELILYKSWEVMIELTRDEIAGISQFVASSNLEFSKRVRNS